MYERTKTILLAGAWLAVAGCGDSEDRSDWTTLQDTLPSGTVHVTNIPAANASPTWTLVEELRVGTLEGTGPDAFAYLKGLVALDDGGFAVLDSQIQELRVFGPDGAHMATHGGKGQGPGEFADANGLMLGPNGRIWVPDGRNGRMSVFDPEDGFIESFSVRGRVLRLGVEWRDGVREPHPPTVVGREPGTDSRLRLDDDAGGLDSGAQR